jgi:hypothetical protein
MVGFARFLLTALPEDLMLGKEQSSWRQQLFLQDPTPAPQRSLCGVSSINRGLDGKKVGGVFVVAPIYLNLERLHECGFSMKEQSLCWIFGCHRRNVAIGILIYLSHSGRLTSPVIFGILQDAQTVSLEISNSKIPRDFYGVLERLGKQ